MSKTSPLHKQMGTRSMLSYNKLHRLRSVVLSSSVEKDKSKEKKKPLIIWHKVPDMK